MANKPKNNKSNKNISAKKKKEAIQKANEINALKQQEEKIKRAEDGNKKDKPGKPENTNSRFYKKYNQESKRRKKKKRDLGKYVSILSKEELYAAQKKKTFFMLGGIFLFAYALIAPADIDKIKKTVNIFLAFNIAAIIFCVYISFQGFRAHKIRTEVDGNYAPKKGFKKSTYISYEIFTVMFLVLLAEQVYIVWYVHDAWAVSATVCMSAAAPLIVVSRFILYNANKSAEYIPPFKKEVVITEANEFYESKPAETETETERAADNENIDDTLKENSLENIKTFNPEEYYNE